MVRNVATLSFFLLLKIKINFLEGKKMHEIALGKNFFFLLFCKKPLLHTPRPELGVQLVAHVLFQV